MDLLSLVSAVLVVEFGVIFLIKILNMGRISKLWYKEFGITAVLCDISSVTIGVMIANLIVPNAGVLQLASAAVIFQILHDVFFYIFVIRPLPHGTNAMIDMMKTYAAEETYTPIIGDSFMMISTVLMYVFLTRQKRDVTALVGVMGLYAITYIIYTK